MLIQVFANQVFTLSRLWQMTQAICFNCLIVSGLGVIVLQGGGEICDEVIDIFDADAQTEHVRIYSGSHLLFRT